MSLESDLQALLSKWRKYLMSGGSLDLASFGKFRDELLATACPKKAAPPATPAPKPAEKLAEKAVMKAVREGEAPPVKKRRPSKPKSE